MVCGFAAIIKDGRFDSLGKGTLTPLSSFPPTVALSFLVSCCESQPIACRSYYHVKYDQNYSETMDQHKKLI